LAAWGTASRMQCRRSITRHQFALLAIYRVPLGSDSLFAVDQSWPVVDFDRLKASLADRSSSRPRFSQISSRIVFLRFTVQQFFSFFVWLEFLFGGFEFCDPEVEFVFETPKIHVLGSNCVMQLSRHVCLRNEDKLKARLHETTIGCSYKRQFPVDTTRLAELSLFNSIIS
jgi:hypothetical protein